MALQLRRGTDIDRLSSVFADGELVYTTDGKKLFVGDGVTSGGTEVGGIDRLVDIGDVDISTNPVVALTEIGIASSVATVTSASPHNLALGDQITIAVDGYPYLDGDYLVNGVVDALTFQYGAAIGSLGLIAITGTVFKNGYLIDDGSVLAYDEVLQSWISQPRELVALVDVEITLPTDNSILTYDSGLGKWIDSPEPSLSLLPDVALSTPLNGDALIYNGTDWVNNALSLSDLNDIDFTTTAPVTGDRLQWNGTDWVPLKTTYEKNITISSPVGALKRLVFFTHKQAILSQIRSLVEGTTPSVNISVRYGTDFSAAGTEVVTGGFTVNNSTTGVNTTTFNNATIPVGNFVWVTTGTPSGTVDTLFVSLTYS